VLDTVRDTVVLTVVVTVLAGVDIGDRVAVITTISISPVTSIRVSIIMVNAAQCITAPSH